MKITSLLYVNVKYLSKKELSFYFKLREYRKYTRSSEEIAQKFKASANGKDIIGTLNILGEGLGFKKRGDVFSEKDYPKVAYRTINEEMYICILNDEMVSNIEVSQIMTISPLFRDANITETGDISSENLKLKVEHKISNLWTNLEGNHIEIFKKGYKPSIMKLMKRIQKFPADSIHELLIENLFSRDEFIEISM